MPGARLPVCHSRPRHSSAAPLASTVYTHPLNREWSLSLTSQTDRRSADRSPRRQGQARCVAILCISFPNSCGGRAPGVGAPQRQRRRVAQVGVEEDPTGAGLVLEWVYGSIVSTAEKARDGAKRTLGAPRPAPRRNCCHRSPTAASTASWWR